MSEREQQQIASFLGMRRQLRGEQKEREMAVSDLLARGRHDPTIGRFIDMWEAGQFPSFENMLCHLAVHLSGEKEHLEKCIIDLNNTRPMPIFVDRD